MSGAIQWTPRQREGIERVGQSILVSAAAGSGKTAVLAQRCAHLVCDAANPCEIDQLLVVTFTESAAAEMKARIQKALRQKLLDQSSPRLARQVKLAQHAHVSTLHGFCHRLLKQNFTLAGVDPAFAILDADEAALVVLLGLVAFAVARGLMVAPAARAWRCALRIRCRRRTTSRPRS